MCSGRQLWILFWILWGTRTSIRLVKQLARHVMAGADERRAIAKANTASPHSGPSRKRAARGRRGRVREAGTRADAVHRGQSRLYLGGHAAEALVGITGDDGVMRFRRMSRGTVAMAEGSDLQP